jgi:hypothetical protein
MNLEESQLEAIRQIKQTCQGMPLACGKKGLAYIFCVLGSSLQTFQE